MMISCQIWASWAFVFSTLQLCRGTPQTDAKDGRPDRLPRAIYNAPPLRGRGIIIFRDLVRKQITTKIQSILSLQKFHVH